MQRFLKLLIPERYLILLPLYFFFFSPWDMGRFFSTQCKLCSIPVPKFARKWIDLRKLYRNFYKVSKCSLQNMVANLGMTFEGRAHSGMDDARNIARILRKLIEDGCEIKFNDWLSDHPQLDTRRLDELKIV